MSRTFADAMAEVQNRANMHRKEISAESWGGELAPGGRGIIVDEKPLPSSELEAQIAEVHAQRNQSVKDMTKEQWDDTIPVTDIATVDHLNRVTEAQKDIQVNKSSNLLDQWKKNNIPQSGALNVPIPTMKEPPLVKEEEMDNDKEQIDELSDFGRAFSKAKEGSTFMYRGKPIKRITAAPGAGKPSTGNAVSKDPQPSGIMAAPRPKTDTPGTQGVAVGKSFSAIDKNRNVVSQNKPAVPPVAPKALGGAKWSDQGAKERAAAPAAQASTVKLSGGDAPVAAPKVAPVPPSRPASISSAPAPTPAPKPMPGDEASANVKKLLAKEESDNPMIAAFLRLQETPGNMFEAAKKKHKNAQAEKYNKGDKDEIDDDPDKGVVATSQAPGAMSESIQRAARVSMFDPSQGYARTAGSADGAASLKEKIAAAWNNLSTGYPATHPATADVPDAIAADMAALKEENISENHKSMEGEILKPGDQVGFKDGVEDYGRIHSISDSGHAKIKVWNDRTGEHDHVTKHVSKLWKEETEVTESKKGASDLAKLAAAAISKGHPVKKLPAGKAEGWADNNRISSMGGGVSKINSRSGSQTKARFREEVEHIGEENEKKEYKKLSYDEFTKGRIENPTAEQHKEIGRRLKKAGVPGSGWHFKKAKEMSNKVKEEIEFSAEELAHIQSVMENNPEGNAIAGRDPNARQGDSDKSTVGGITNESKKKK
jgi:hypothetical protein